MSCGTLVPAAAFSFSLTRLLRSLALLSNSVQLTIASAFAGPQPHGACSLVWATPTSLAATMGIDFSFSSSGYLDVSVPRVPSWQTIHSSAGDSSSSCRVSPFGHQGIYACLRLPLAFRSLPRPSSALGALASTLCSSSLDYYPETSLQFSGQLTFLFATGLSKTRFLFLCSCQDAPTAFAVFQGRNPENDTEQRRQLLLRTIPCPSFDLRLPAHGLSSFTKSLSQSTSV